jgi:hypothetical protein
MDRRAAIASRNRMRNTIGLVPVKKQNPRGFGDHLILVRDFFNEDAASRENQAVVDRLLF